MVDNASDYQIKNSILSTNEIVLGSSTSKAMATMYLNLAHSAGMATQNAVANQQHLNILGAAAVAAGAGGLLRTGLADQVEKISLNERLDYLQKLLALAAGAATQQSAAAKTDTDTTAAPVSPAEVETPVATPVPAPADPSPTLDAESLP
ncbi:RebB family R body protein [Sneathiella sp.]|uniref:RebB family R body protein n=1 Tax=Sneathiella sp. TaxID=1964365 RepID=UPI0035642462